MSNLMKAAVFHGVRDVRIEDVPKPTAGPGEVVLRVQRCSVCGTDKRIFTHGQKNVVPPAITGHEIVGTVYEIGLGREQWTPHRPRGGGGDGRGVRKVHLLPTQAI